MSELKHYGVLGMKWGHRKGLGQTVVHPGVSGSVKEVGGLVKDAASDDIAKAKKLASAVANNKVFKSIVYNKDNGGFIRKDKLEAAKATLKNVLTKIAERSIRQDISAQDRDIKLFRDISARYDQISKVRPLTVNERKDKMEMDKAAKILEDELNSLFTPEELNKYRS